MGENSGRAHIRHTKYGIKMKIKTKMLRGCQRITTKIYAPTGGSQALSSGSETTSADTGRG